jgi:hypothetical protein
MLHMSKLAKLENGQPPPALGSFEAEHIQILVSIVMDPLKWMYAAPLCRNTESTPLSPRGPCKLRGDGGVCVDACVSARAFVWLL